MKSNNLKLPIITLSISLLISFFLLNDLLLSLLISAISGFFSLRISKAESEHKIFYDNLNKIYQFCNLLNIQFYTTNSIQEAFLRISQFIDEDFLLSEEEDLLEMLTQKSQNYNINAYKMYIKILDVYEKNGGNIKK